jgi:hypothetical protein
MFEIVLGAIVIIITALLAEKVPPKWRKLLWTLFIVFVAVQAVIQIRARIDERRKSETSENTQRQLKSELDQSLLNQQYTKGQLDSLSLTVGRLGQPTAQGDALAAAIKQMAQATAQNANDLRASNEDLCKRAHAKAEEIRVFQEKYDDAELESQLQDFQAAARATTDDQRRGILSAQDQKRTNARLAHESEFRSKYMPQAKYLRDLLMERVPPSASDMLMRNNGQAEANFSISTLVGAFSESVIATYLDEIANVVCPQTAEQKKAQQSKYRAIVARLREFEAQGNTLHERCGPASTNPPTAAEVDRWIANANQYILKSALEEHLKNEFENASLTNGTYVGTAPGCANLMGKILDKGSRIGGLEQYLANTLN